MVRKVSGREDDEPAERGVDSLDACAHVALPQLQVSAILIRPVAIEVDEYVYPPAQSGTSNVERVEVRVDCQHPARCREVHAAAKEGRVGNEARDAGQELQEAHKRCGLESSKEESRHRPHVSLAIDR